MNTTYTKAGGWKMVPSGVAKLLDSSFLSALILCKSDFANDYLLVKLFVDTCVVCVVKVKLGADQATEASTNVHLVVNLKILIEFNHSTKQVYAMVLLL